MHLTLMIDHTLLQSYELEQQFEERYMIPPLEKVSLDQSPVTHLTPNDLTLEKVSLDRSLVTHLTPNDLTDRLNPRRKRNAKLHLRASPVSLSIL